MPSYAVTGASRGIGFAFIKHLASDPSNVVFALVRSLTGSPQLLELAASHKNIHILKGDVTSPTELAEAAESVSKITGGSLDILIENAALMIGESAPLTLTDLVGDVEKTQTFDRDMQASINANVLSTVHTTNAFLPLIRQSEIKKIVVLSSGIGDIEGVVEWGLKDSVPYCVSKAAVNMIVAKYATVLADEGVTIVAISPGLVRTQTQDWAPQFYDAITKVFQKTKASFEGPLEPEKSVSMMLDVVEGLTVKDSGRFLSHNGNKDWL